MCESQSKRTTNCPSNKTGTTKLGPKVQRHNNDSKPPFVEAGSCNLLSTMHIYCWHCAVESTALVPTNAISTLDWKHFFHSLILKLHCANTWLCFSPSSLLKICSKLTSWLHGRTSSADFTYVWGVAEWVPDFWAAARRAEIQGLWLSAQQHHNVL